MGWDAVSYLEPATKVDRVLRTLVGLGFVRTSSDHTTPKVAHLFYFREQDYASLSPIRASVSVVDGGCTVTTHTLLERSQHDCETHNLTLRRLRELHGGHFNSDVGRNKYFKFRGVRRGPCESGCYLAYRRLERNLNHAESYLFLRQFGALTPPKLVPLHPLPLSNSLVRVFLVTSVEDYLKSTYESLLRYSDRKAVALRDAGRLLSGDDLAAISDGRSLEAIVADSIGFSNLTKSCRHFSTLDPSLNLEGALRKPFRRRRVSLFDSVTAMIEARNEFIHRSYVDERYDATLLAADFSGVAAATDRIYTAIVARHGWTLELGSPRRRLRQLS